MKTTFLWQHEGGTKEEQAAEDERIAQAFVKGNLGEFIQEVLGGDVLLLSTVTADERKAFAVFKLTQLNLQSIEQAELESAINALRNSEISKRAPRELPAIPRRKKNQ